MFAAGMVGGPVQQVVVVPGDRIKCLLQIQRGGRGYGQYRGTVDCVKTILRNEGLRGMFRGMGAGIARDSPANGVYFLSYQIVLRHILGDGKEPADVWPVEVALAGGTAGVMYWLSAIPIDVLKSRYVTSPAGTYPTRDTGRFSSNCKARRIESIRERSDASFDSRVSFQCRNIFRV